MASPRLLTFCDVLDAAGDFCTGHGGAPAHSALRQIVIDSYSEFCSVRDWNYLGVSGRLRLQAAVSTGTVVYDNSDRTLTLDGAVWPGDAEDWSVYFDGVECDIASRTSDTVVVLDETLNPGRDVASTTYTAYPRYYRLPGDFVSMGPPMDEANWWIGAKTDMEMMAVFHRYWNGSGQPQYYAIGPCPDRYGYSALYVWPPADTAGTYDYVGKRRPRDLRHSGKESAESQGTVVVAAGSRVVAGTGTAFKSTMAGAVFRYGSSATAIPTRIAGASPFVEEHAVASVSDGTTLILASDPATSEPESKGTTPSGVKYVVSDPVDLPPALHQAFVACVKKNIAFERNMKEYALCVANYEDLLFRAKCADAPSSETLIAGSRPVFISRLADGTIGEEV